MSFFIKTDSLYIHFHSEPAPFFSMLSTEHSQPYLTGLFGDVIQAKGDHFRSGSNDELTKVVSYHHRAQTVKARLFEQFQVHI